MLEQLGFNWTFYIQFVIFIFTISFLSIYVFGPYSKAVEDREKQTKGSEADAVEMDRKSAAIYSEYEIRARQVHGSIQEVYKEARSQAAQEQEKLISAARAEAEKVAEESRGKINAAIRSAEETLKKDVPQIVMALTQKLLGK